MTQDLGMTWEPPTVAGDRGQVAQYLTCALDSEDLPGLFREPEFREHGFRDHGCHYQGFENNSQFLLPKILIRS